MTAGQPSVEKPVRWEKGRSDHPHRPRAGQLLDRTKLQFPFKIETGERQCRRHHLPARSSVTNFTVLGRFL
ncbi:hypothetical protein MEA186_06750 [Mesorhizobium amorphae CCNWGS0123]|uniref:Uncharacterized protein n=1 Tax=Mesorhizobium amorphae CCNWGS0123 TaxID=1082933 RepID=G6Y5Z0_9HYPH|nr:hypothetical protein MEA186_06750 [Mesorhizobium amorphae CCNWGS0123]